MTLDVATGTGHTAFHLARKQAHVFAVDINSEMLRVAQEESDRQTLGVRFLKGSAEDLNFDDNGFDLVTCRLAAHHFEDVAKCLEECWRVLRPNGHLLLIDNVVPTEPSTAQWINEFEKRRDPSHRRCLSEAEWKEQLSDSGFTLCHSEEYRKKLLYGPWMERMSHQGEVQDELWEFLENSSEQVRKHLKPRRDKDGKLSLRLTRQILVAQKKS